jgi:oxygen-independent coproporphyrinogen-3 oxidase
MSMILLNEPRLTEPSVAFDRRLIRKYDGPGPRYTSYPTAPAFQDSFGPQEHAELLAASARGGAPLSLYVHVPFCATRCLFCGCNVVISRDRSWGGRYLPLLAREMERVAEGLGAKDREVVQVHWGGGTPTFLPPADLRELMATIRSRFRLAEDCEISVEVDPREASPEHLDALAEAGVGRLSMGIQDLDPQVQWAIRRVQSGDLTRSVIEGARARGIGGINVDLIYGLPHQTVPGFIATVREVLALAPDRLAVFNLAYLPTRFRHQRAIDPAALPGPEEKLSLLEEAVREITQAGYVFIGMDHFARPGDPLAQAMREGTMTRNFQGYSTHAETDLAAFGISAISAFGGAGGGYAQNVRTIPEYRAALEAGTLPTERGLALSADDRLRRDVILDLMCDFALDKKVIEERHGIEFDQRFATELRSLEPLAADGLVELRPGRIEVTPRGRFVVRNVAMAFDAYLGKQSGVQYSRTV